MTISRRNLFRLFSALPFVGVVGLVKAKHPLLLEGVIKHKTDTWGEVLTVGPHQRAKYRWVAADITRDRMEEWAKKNPWFLKKYKKEDII